MTSAGCLIATDRSPQPDVKSAEWIEGASGGTNNKLLVGKERSSRYLVQDTSPVGLGIVLC